MESKHSSWTARDHFIKWRDFLDSASLLFKESSGVTNIQFASDVFDAAFMEISAQMGSLYSMVVALSTVLLLLAFFTASLRLLLIIITTVFTCLATLFGSFYYLGVEAGAVEIVGASILIGSSVDYVFHLVESYATFSKRNEEEDDPDDVMTNFELRKLNCQRAMKRIGLSIISSSLTTSLGCVPLTFAGLNPLRVFGILIMISSTSALLFTLFYALPLLAILGPVGAETGLKRRSITFGIVAIVLGITIALVFILGASEVITIYDPQGF